MALKTSVSDLIGKVLCKIDADHDIIHFYTIDNEHYYMKHYQDCCETVFVDDICGDLMDLVWSPITQAEESSKRGKEGGESATWTFYRFATAKGLVVIKWFGTSNGYYSENVGFYKGVNR